MRDSSPCHPLPDPFSDEAIALELRHTWRRALPGASDLDQVRAKSIRLGETATPIQSRESNRNSNVVPIETNSAAHRAAAQRVPRVQRELRETERDVLEILDEHGPVLPVRRIAELLDCDTESLRDREIHALQRDGFIESRPGRGYELTELGKAAL